MNQSYSFLNAAPALTTMASKHISRNQKEKIELHISSGYFIHIVVHAYFLLPSLNLRGVYGELQPPLLWLSSANILLMVFCRIVVVLYMHWSIQPMQLHTCAGQSCGVLTGFNRHQWAISLKEHWQSVEEKKEKMWSKIWQLISDKWRRGLEACSHQAEKLKLVWN